MIKVNDKPVFILGCSKSGTTLLRNLFDGHSDLFVVPMESHFFQNGRLWINYFTRRTKPENVSIDQFKRNLINWVKFQNSKENKVADGFTSGRWNVKLFEEILISTPAKDLRELSDLYFSAMFKSLFNKELSSDLRVVEKSVENTELINEWLDIYPEATFIYILRNPYANLVALRTFSKKKINSLKMPLYSMYNSYYHLYRNKNRNIKMKIIKYEDLIVNSAEVMKQLCEFIGIDFNNVLLTPKLLGENWFGNSTSSESFSGISDKRIDSWKDDIYKHEINMINELFGFVFRDFNYEFADKHSLIYKNAKRDYSLSYLSNKILSFYFPRFR